MSVPEKTPMGSEVGGWIPKCIVHSTNDPVIIIQEGLVGRRSKDFGIPLLWFGFKPTKDAFLKEGWKSVAGATFLLEEYHNVSRYGSVAFVLPFDLVVRSYEERFGPGSEASFYLLCTRRYTKERSHTLLVSW
jgi:hypothetical protein